MFMKLSAWRVNTLQTFKVLKNRSVCILNLGGQPYTLRWWRHEVILPPLVSIPCSLSLSLTHLYTHVGWFCSSTSSTISSTSHSQECAQKVNGGDAKGWDFTLIQLLRNNQILTGCVLTSFRLENIFWALLPRLESSLRREWAPASE